MTNQILPIGHPDSKGHESHFITAREGAEMVRAYEEHPDPHSLPKFRHVTFHGEAVKALLAQDGAVAVRSSLAVHNGHLTLVQFAVDAEGFITGNLAIQNGQGCPPFC